MDRQHVLRHPTFFVAASVLSACAFVDVDGDGAHELVVGRPAGADLLRPHATSTPPPASSTVTASSTSCSPIRPPSPCAPATDTAAWDARDIAVSDGSTILVLSRTMTRVGPAARVPA